MDGTSPELQHKAAAVRTSLREAIAQAVGAGLELAQTRGLLGADEFALWCPGACSIPLPEAELMIRWGTARPNWANPAAVDLADPVAAELIELSANRWARSAGVDLVGEMG